jgi:dihydropyrimidinase/dihydroorotase
MTLTVVLRSGAVVTPAGIVRADIGFDGDRIAVVGAPQSIAKGHREFDLDGKFVLPGLIDPHVHLGLGDEIGDEKMAEDFAMATRDCLVGGVTTIATTIAESRDPLSTRFDRALKCSASGSWVDHKFTSVVGTSSDISDIPYVIARGCIGFKFFTGYAGAQAEEFGMGPEGITPELFFRAGRVIKDTSSECYVAIHAEEPFVRAVLVEEAQSQSHGDHLLRAWMMTSPYWAETVQVVLYGFVAHSAGVPLYVVHISSALTLDAIEWLRSRGVQITAETLALFLSTTADEQDQAGVAAKAKIQPPIRGEDDRASLWAALRCGAVTIIGTDSLTYSAEFKQGHGFWEDRVGVNAQFADTLPLLWDASAREQVGLETLVAALSENAAKRLALYPRKGAILPGSDADVVVVDPERECELGVHRYRGGADYSLWEGRKVRGLPVMTFLRGELVMCDGEITVDTPNGRYVPAATLPVRH